MLTLAIYSLIVLLGITSYLIALRQIHLGNYKPNLFSRIIWLLLSVNSFMGVVLSKSSSSSLVLSTILLIGSASICLLSIKHGRRQFGTLEKICLGILLISLGIWVYFDAPLINLALSLFAYTVGAVPTYRSVWERPSSENKSFWLLFFAASLLSLSVGINSSLQKLLVPIYYCLFDGSMFLLTLRKTGIIKRLFS